MSDAVDAIKDFGSSVASDLRDLGRDLRSGDIGGFIEGTFNMSLDLVSAGGFSAAKEGYRTVRDMINFEPPGSDFKDRKRSFRASTSPRNIIYGRVRTGAQIVYMETSGDESQYLHMIMVFAAHQCQKIEEILVDDEVVATVDANGDLQPQGEFDGVLIGSVELGAQSAANSLAVNNAPNWTTEHMLLGQTYVYLRFEYDDEVFTGQPRVTATIKGKNDIWDPRDDSVGYTDNQGLVMLDYILWSRGFNADQSDVDIEQFKTLADVADEQMEAGGGQTEPRYTVNGSIRMTNAPVEVLGMLADAGNARPVNTQGVWKVTPGKYISPALEFNESDLVGGLSFNTIGKQDRSNVARGTFVSPAHNFEGVDFPEIRVQDYIDTDNEELELQTEFPMTNSGTMARRLSKIQIERSRYGIMANATFKFRAVQLVNGDRLKLSIDQLGWDKKVFRVEDVVISLREGVSLTLREDGPEVYNWEEGDALAVDVPPSVDLPDGKTVNAPAAINVSEELFTANTVSAVKARMLLSWSEVRTARSYDVQYKLQQESQWRDAATNWLATGLTIDDVKPGGYDIRVRAINGINRKSAWTNETFTVVGKTAPPPDVSQFQAEPARDRVELNWAESSVLDISHYEIREGNDWSTATFLTTVDGNSHQTRKASNGPWLIKAVDTSGNPSENAAKATISPTLPEVLNVRSQVVDNNVLLRWDKIAGDFDIQTFDIRKGDTLAESESVGDSDKTFDVVFELSAGTFTYWIVPVDAAGNQGAHGSITTAVDDPPDFVLRNQFSTDWIGNTMTALEPIARVPRPSRLTTQDRASLEFDGNSEAPIDGWSYSASRSQLAFEIWFNTRADSGVLWSYDRSEYWGLELGGSAAAGPGRLGVSFTTDAGLVDNFDTPDRVDDGRWHHLAFTYDNGAATLYLDGEQVNSLTSGTTIGSGTTRFGYFGTGSEADTFAGPSGGAIYKGRLAEARLWDGVIRTATQIQDNKDSSLQGDESGLVGYWRMNAGGGPTVTDMTGSGNDADISSAGITWRTPEVEAVVPTSDLSRDELDTLGYASRDDMIAAGYDYRAQPVPTSAQFTEVYDTGTVIPSTRILVTHGTTPVNGNVDIQTTISTKENIGDPWTDFPVGQSRVFATQFRWVKVTVDYSADDDKSFIVGRDIQTVLSTKIKSDSGLVTVTQNPTIVQFDTDFVDIEEITATAKGTTAKQAVTDFDDTANPDSFDIYLFDSDGNPATGDVSWSAEGF